MQRKRQFQTAPQRRTFFDRKVRHTSYTTVISMGKVIPKDWTYARITIMEQDATHILIDITKLLGSEPLALHKAPNPHSRQDT